MTPTRVLIVNPFGIGDVLFTTPVIRALRQAWPQAHLAFLGNRRTEPLLRHNPHLNDVVVFEKDEYRQLWRSSPLQCLRHLLGWIGQLRAQRFELALDVSLNSRFGLMLWLMGIPARVGFDYRRRGLFLTRRFPLAGFDDKPVVDYYFDLVAGLGITTSDRRLEVVVPAELQAWAQQRLGQFGMSLGESIIGIIPGGGASWGSSASLRRWDVAGFVTVAQRLSRRERARLLLFGDRSDQELCGTIARALGDRVVNLCGQLTLMEFVAMLERCRLVICNDGGPLHLAVAAGVKTISVFGPVNERVYGPYPPNGRHRVVAYDPGCRPCYQRFHLPPCPIDRECLRRVTADDVTRAAEELLAAS